MEPFAEGALNQEGEEKVMRRIQIEGEEEEYQMDEQGNIYDLNGNFIGVANPDEIEEMLDYGAEGGVG